MDDSYDYASIDGNAKCSANYVTDNEKIKKNMVDRRIREKKS